MTDYLQDAIDRVRSADEQAERARLSFVLGRGSEYMAKVKAEIEERWEDEYGPIEPRPSDDATTDGRNHREDQRGDGTVDRNESGGVARAQTQP